MLSKKQHKGTVLHSQAIQSLVQLDNDTKSNAKCKNWGGLGWSPKVIANDTI